MRESISCGDIPLSRPDVTRREIEYVVSVLKTPHLSLGPVLQKFEDRLAKFVGSRFAIATSSGTSALHLALKAVSVRRADMVITTPFSFIASANVILYEGAIPIFADIDKRTLNIDPEEVEKILRYGSKVQKTRARARAILGVDIFGQPADWDSLNRLSREYGLATVEDSCEALGAQYRERRAGTLASVGAFAFYPNKVITTGEGGAIVTDKKKIAEICLSLRNQGRSSSAKEWLSHEVLGYNYRMSDINAALGLAQLERISGILKKRERAASVYTKLLSDVGEVTAPAFSPAPGVTISWFVYVILLSRKFSSRDRASLIQFLCEKGIGCASYFPVIHLQKFYRQMFGFRKGDFPVAESVSERTIALPFYTNITQESITRVVSTLKDGIALWRRGGLS
jgi:perosamine synthetase